MSSVTQFLNANCCWFCVKLRLTRFPWIMRNKFLIKGNFRIKFKATTTIPVVFKVTMRKL